MNFMFLQKILIPEHWQWIVYQAEAKHETLTFLGRIESLSAQQVSQHSTI